jgi:hypothetical protein
MPYSTVRPIERFMQKVEIDPAAGRDACWLWNGWLASGTQPGFHPRGDKGAGPAPARRWAFQHFHRCALSADDKIAASCRNPPCVSPLHAVVRGNGLPPSPRDESELLGKSASFHELPFAPFVSTQNGDGRCATIGLIQTGNCRS